MGKISKGVKCSVSGCDNEGVRSLSLLDVSKYLELKSEKSLRRAILCKIHYKEYKKKSKKDKKTEKMRYGLGPGAGKSRGLKGPMS